MSDVRKHASIATIAVAGSRVMGLVREVVFAFFFGASPVLDAFIAAFRIPNLLRDLFAEGALSNSFVTIFSQKTASEGDQSAWELANRVMTFILLVVGGFTVLGILFSPLLVTLAASGFTGEKFTFAITLNRVLFPFILFVSLAAVAMGMLNTKGKFALPQSASTFFNITSIVAGLLFAWIASPHYMTESFRSLIGHGTVLPDWSAASKAMVGMAVGTLLGGLVQWLIQMPPLLKMGFHPRFTMPFKDPDFLKVLKLTGPAVIGGAAVQVNVLINTNFASYLTDGSISWLNYAFRLMQFPIGVFGVAIAVATTPALARLLTAGEGEGFRDTLAGSSKMALFLCVPSALGLMVLAEPIIGLIYQHGQFSSYDTLQAANALRAYAVGLSFYSLVKIYQPAFLAHGDAHTPMLISLLSIGINFFINWILVFGFGFAHWGLALGTSCVAAWNAVMLIGLLRKRSPGVWSPAVVKEIFKIVAASLVMTLLTGAAYGGLRHLLGNGNAGMRFLLVILPMGVALGSYTLFCTWMQVGELAQFKKMWARKREKPVNQGLI